MAISQPLATDPQNSPSHSLQHRQIATDPSTPLNGMIWSESDGIHCYVNGAENTLDMTAV